MKINLLRPNNTTITLDVAKIDAISGIVDGKFELYAGSLTYTINSSEYTRVSNVLGTASSGGGSEESGGMEVVYTTERDLTLEPNKYYIFGECSTLNINIGEPTTGGKLNEYRFEFDSGSTPTVLTLPNTVNPSTLNILEDTKYVISIKNNVLVEAGSKYTDLNPFVTNLCNRTITSIVIPEGVTSVPLYLFLGCISLISVSLPSTLRTIGQYAFQGCTALTEITIPEGVTYIGNYAFQNCTALSNIVFPTTLTSIGTYAFQNDYALAEVNLPNTLTSLDMATFYTCRGLTNFVFPSSLRQIPSAVVLNCTSLVSVTIPLGVTNIVGSAFRSCSSLPSIVIPSTVTTINNDTFNGCSSLREISLYDGVSAIGNNAFTAINSGCRVRIYGTSSVIPFMIGAPAAVKFYVDPTMVQAYKTNSAWSARASYIYSLNDYIE